jgi:hypothetical protein
MKGGEGGIVEYRNGSDSRAVLIATAGLLGALGCVASYALLCLVFGASISLASTPEELTPRAFLPLVMNPPGAVEPTLTIYDLDGMERDWDWLVANFGAVTLNRGTGAASVTVLRAVEGPNALVIHVENSEGTPMENVPVVFYWPDAPELPPEQQACGLDRGIVGYTKSSGDVDFAMGPGAYYFPPGAGPHVVWVPVEGTDCLRGLGMLGGTNHIHLDSVWRVP